MVCKISSLLLHELPASKLAVLPSEHDKVLLLWYKDMQTPQVKKGPLQPHEEMLIMHKQLWAANTENARHWIIIFTSPR